MTQQEIQEILDNHVTKDLKEHLDSINEKFKEYEDFMGPYYDEYMEYTNKHMKKGKPYKKSGQITMVAVAEENTTQEYKDGLYEYVDTILTKTHKTLLDMNPDLEFIWSYFGTSEKIQEALDTNKPFRKIGRILQQLKSREQIFDAERLCLQIGKYIDENSITLRQLKALIKQKIVVIRTCEYLDLDTKKLFIKSLNQLVRNKQHKEKTNAN